MLEKHCQEHNARISVAREWVILVLQNGSALHSGFQSMAQMVFQRLTEESSFRSVAKSRCNGLRSIHDQIINLPSWIIYAMTSWNLICLPEVTQDKSCFTKPRCCGQHFDSTISPVWDAKESFCLCRNRFLVSFAPQVKFFERTAQSTQTNSSTFRRSVLSSFSNSHMRLTQVRFQ